MKPAAGSDVAGSAAILYQVQQAPASNPPRGRKGEGMAPDFWHANRKWPRCWRRWGGESKGAGRGGPARAFKPGNTAAARIAGLAEAGN